MVVLHGCLESNNLLILVLPSGLVVRKVPPLDQVLCCAVTEGAVVEGAVDLEPGGLDAIFVIPVGCHVSKYSVTTSFPFPCNMD